MKRYISTLRVNTDLFISARISISYYSETRKNSPKQLDRLTLRVGPSVVQIYNLPQEALHRTLRHILVPIVCFPSFIGNRKLCDPKAALRCVSIWKHKNLLRLQTKRLRGLPLTFVMDEALSSILKLLVLMPPVRISIPYVPNSMDFEELMLMKYLSLFALWRQRLSDSNSSQKRGLPSK